METANTLVIFFVEDHAVAIDLVFHEGVNHDTILVVLTNGKILTWLNCSVK
jgi:hypothetical protein